MRRRSGLARLAQIVLQLRATHARLPERHSRRLNPKYLSARAGNSGRGGRTERPAKFTRKMRLIGIPGGVRGVREVGARHDLTDGPQHAPPCAVPPKWNPRIGREEVLKARSRKPDRPGYVIGGSTHHRARLKRANDAHDPQIEVAPLARTSGLHEIDQCFPRPSGTGLIFVEQPERPQVIRMSMKHAIEFIRVAHEWREHSSPAYSWLEIDDGERLARHVELIQSPGRNQRSPADRPMPLFTPKPERPVKARQ